LTLNFFSVNIEGDYSIIMGKEFPEKNKKRKIWNKPSLDKLALRDTLSGGFTTVGERAKTDVYGSS